MRMLDAQEAQDARHPRSEEDQILGRKPQSLLEEEAAQARQQRAAPWWQLVKFEPGVGGTPAPSAYEGRFATMAACAAALQAKYAKVVASTRAMFRGSGVVEVEEGPGLLRWTLRINRNSPLTQEARCVQRQPPGG